MAVADERREGCDGCGRTVSLEDLTAVTMPDGERIACCPQCEPHARAAVDGSESGSESGDRTRGTCDGCNDTVPRDELADIELPDGTVVSCCVHCFAEIPGQGGPTGRTSASSGTGSSTDTDDRNRAGSSTKTNTSTGTNTSAGTDSSSGRTSSTGTTSSTGASSAEGVESSTDGTSSTAEDDSDDETTDLATTGNRCSQCHELVTVELFAVTTVDGRSEEMCPECKSIAKEKGVVKSVKMREREAREILGVEEDAGQEEIRKAFHRQVKNAHPDRKTGSRSAFKMVKEAYERLS